jgi:hypothetical protein
MQKIPKQEYSTEFKERGVTQVNEGKSIGLSAKECQTQDASTGMLPCFDFLSARVAAHGL